MKREHKDGELTGIEWIAHQFGECIIRYEQHEAEDEKTKEGRKFRRLMKEVLECLEGDERKVKKQENND